MAFRNIDYSENSFGPFRRWVANNFLTSEGMLGELYDIQRSINVQARGITEEGDQYNNIQSLINELGALDYDVRLLFPSGKTYKVSKGLSCPYDNINVVMDGEILYMGSSNEPIITVGEPSMNCKRLKHEFNIRRDTQSDWSSEDNVGVRLINHFNCDININRSAKSTVGVDCAGISQGFAYNNFYLKEIRDNKISILLRNQAGGGLGYCNENNFYNGRIWTTSGTNDSLDRVGIVIRSDDGSYLHNNNNKFYSTSIEILGGTGTATGIRLEDNSRQNYFNHLRLEGCDYGWHLKDKAYKNKLIIGYPPIQDELDESANCDNTILGRGRPYLEEAYKSVFKMSDIVSKANYWDDVRVHIDGLSMMRSNADQLYRRDAGYDIFNDYIEFPETKACGFEVNTKQVKNFVFLRDAAGNNGGRVVVRLFDSSGSLITNASHISSAQTSNISSTSLYGGAFRTGTDNAEPVNFKLSDSVSYIWIGIGGGASGDAQIRGFQLLSQGVGHPSTKPGHGETYGVGFLAVDVIAGAYKTGDRIYNAEPTAGGNVGWVVTNGGDFATATPPTVKTFGTIEP